MKSPSLASFFNRLAATYTHRQLTTFSLPRSVVSFSFDDFPSTALTNGGRILEAQQLRGTYYVASKLCDTESTSGLIASDEDIATCIERGHELACHTYDHMNCLHHSSLQIAASMRKNQEMIQSQFALALEHFSYPYGRVSPTAKKLAMRYYQSARTTLPGINRGGIDLGMLKASALYSRRGTEAWQPYLHDLNIKPGWLIFYTHDVSDHPSNYGCTGEELQTVVAQTLAMGYDILPIGEVVRRLKKETGMESE